MAKSKKTGRSFDLKKKSTRIFELRKKSIRFFDLTKDDSSEIVPTIQDTINQLNGVPSSSTNEKKQDTATVTASQEVPMFTQPSQETPDQKQLTQKNSASVKSAQETSVQAELSKKSLVQQTKPLKEATTRKKPSQKTSAQHVKTELQMPSEKISSQKTKDEPQIVGKKKNRSLLLAVAVLVLAGGLIFLFKGTDNTEKEESLPVAEQVDGVRKNQVSTSQKDTPQGVASDTSQEGNLNNSKSSTPTSVGAVSQNEPSEDAEIIQEDIVSKPLEKTESGEVAQTSVGSGPRQNVSTSVADVASKKNNTAQHTVFGNDVSTIPQLAPTLEEQAQQVIRGEFGNGEERKRKLGAAYAEIQRKVNELYRTGNNN